MDIISGRVLVAGGNVGKKHRPHGCPRDLLSLGITHCSDLRAATSFSSNPLGAEAPGGWAFFSLRGSQAASWPSSLQVKELGQPRAGCSPAMTRDLEADVTAMGLGSRQQGAIQRPLSSIPLWPEVKGSSQSPDRGNRRPACVLGGGLG